MNAELLLEMLEESGQSPRLVSGESQIVVVHHDCGDVKGHLYISAEHGGWQCHHCGLTGNIAELLEEVCGLDAFTAHRKAGRVLASEGTIHPRGITTHAVSLPDHFIPDRGYGPAGDYLERRHLDRRLCQKYGIGYCLLGDYAHRVIVPVYTQGELRTFIARAWGNISPKILTAKHSNAGAALFNLDNVPPPICLIVEGVFDALRLPDVAIATLGAKTTATQRNILRDSGFTDLLLLRDADAAGEEAAQKEAFELSASFFHVQIAHLPQGKDPAEATLEEVTRAIDNANMCTIDYSQRCLGM